MMNIIATRMWFWVQNMFQFIVTIYWNIRIFISYWEIWIAAYWFDRLSKEMRWCLKKYTYLILKLWIPQLYIYILYLINKTYYIVSASISWCKCSRFPYLVVLKMRIGGNNYIDFKLFSTIIYLYRIVPKFSYIYDLTWLLLSLVVQRLIWRMQNLL